MTRRLLWSYVGLVALVLVALVAPLDVVGARYEHQLAASQAGRIATGVAVGASADVESGRLDALQAVADRYHAQTGGEIDIVGPGGASVARAGTDRDNNAGEGRKLLAAALAGTSATETDTGGDGDEALAAVPIAAPGGGTPRSAVLLEVSAASTGTRIDQLHAALVAFSVFALALAAALGIVIARSVARPVAQLSAGARRFGRNDLSARVGAVSGPPEIRELATTLDEMAERLEQLVNAQAAFVADASHQLRSPLTALRLRLENLEAALGGDHAAALGAATQELHRLSRLVDGLLSLNRADQRPHEPAVVEVGAVVAERAAAWDAYALERRVRLEVPPQPGRWEAPLVPGDLDQIIDNLLANALQVAPAGSTVTLVVRPLPRAGVALHVIDEGPGLPPEHRARAFDRFWQGPGADTANSGLGLAIVRELSARNHLRVALDASRAGRGLDAVVEIPAASRRSAAAVAARP